MMGIFFTHRTSASWFDFRSFSLRLCVLCVLLFATPVFAQTPVTADAVNAVAKRLYCPVCENQPLDTCMTEACYRWRDEIRVQLEAGSTTDQVVADFVLRFGERAVGTPLDPALRALTLVTPFALAALALIGGVFTFARWRGRSARAPMRAAALQPNDDDYLAQVERDLRG